jgi:type IV secretion system protein VirD4
MRHPDLERDLRNTLRIKGDEAGSVYSTVNANLTPWLDPLVMRNTSACDARIEDIVNREQPVTWYNISPMNRADMMRPIIKLWYTMAYRKLVPDMDVDRGSKRTVSPWRHPAIWLMNERGSLGMIEVEQEVLPVAASYGFIFDYLYQGQGQLEETAGENEVVTDNCGIQVFHTPQDPEDQEVLSKRLGNRTVYIENVSFSQGHRTRSWQVEQMPLMTPEQVGMMPTEPRFVLGRDGKPVKDEDQALAVNEPAYQLIWAPNCPPIYARKSQWFTNGRLVQLISRIPSVIPKPLNASSALAEAYAIEEQVRSTPYAPESDTRRKARIADAIAMKRLDPDDAGSGGGAALIAPSAPSPAPPTPPPPRAGVTPVTEERSQVKDAQAAGHRRGAEARAPGKKRRVIAFQDRVVAKKRAPASETSPVAGFESILATDEGRTR